MRRRIVQTTKIVMPSPGSSGNWSFGVKLSAQNRGPWISDHTLVYTLVLVLTNNAHSCTIDLNSALLYRKHSIFPQGRIRRLNSLFGLAIISARISTFHLPVSFTRTTFSSQHALIFFPFWGWKYHYAKCLA